MSEVFARVESFGMYVHDVVGSHLPDVVISQAIPRDW